MNIQTITIRKLLRPVIACLLVAALATACKKDDSVKPGGETEVPSDDTMFNRLITVLDMGDALPANHQPMDDTSPLYYSLENKSTVDQTYQQTARWDISFNGIYRSFIGGNNGSNIKNLGYKGSGIGGILILTKAFDDVTDIPSDDQFRTGSSIIGTDDYGFFGEGVGYYCYDFGGTLFNDGSYDYQHIAYCLADTVINKFGQKLSPRTLVVKTANGNYAKIKMMSLYKGQLNPKDWRRNSPHTYYSFQYVLAKKGSKKFTINK